MGHGILLQLEPLHRRLTDDGLERVSDLLHRYGAVGWFTHYCIDVERITLGELSDLGAELGAIIAQASVPTWPGGLVTVGSIAVQRPPTGAPRGLVFPKSSDRRDGRGRVR